MARLALVAAALTQLWLCLPVLLFGHDHDVSVHPAHELGSFTAALAVGALAVAWRPRFARGMRPLVGVAGVLLVVTAGMDLASGRTTFSDEAHHLLVVAEYLLMCVLVWIGPRAAGRRDALPPRPAVEIADVHDRQPYGFADDAVYPHAREGGQVSA
jgi:predicted anti-sigma-YlaC factor YlaD